MASVRVFKAVALSSQCVPSVRYNAGCEDAPAKSESYAYASILLRPSCTEGWALGRYCAEKDEFEMYGVDEDSGLEGWHPLRVYPDAWFYLHDIEEVR